LTLTSVREYLFAILIQSEESRPDRIRSAEFPLGRVKNCKFDAMLTAKKSRAEKYDIKLAIKGTFEDVIKHR